MEPRLVPYFATNLGGYQEIPIAKFARQVSRQSSRELFLLSNFDVTLPDSRVPLLLVKKIGGVDGRLDCGSYLSVPLKSARRPGDYVCIGISFTNCVVEGEFIYRFLTRASELVSDSMESVRFSYETIDWSGAEEEWKNCLANVKEDIDSGIIFAFRERTLGVTCVGEKWKDAVAVSIINNVLMFQEMATYIILTLEQQQVFKAKRQIKVITFSEFRSSVQDSLRPRLLPSRSEASNATFNHANLPALTVPAVGGGGSQLGEVDMGNGIPRTDANNLYRHVDRAFENVSQLASDVDMIKARIRVIYAIAVAIFVVCASVLIAYVAVVNKTSDNIAVLQAQIAEIKGSGIVRGAVTEQGSSADASRAAALSETDVAAVRQSIKELLQLTEKCMLSPCAPSSPLLAKQEELEKKIHEILEPGGGGH